MAPVAPEPTITTSATSSRPAIAASQMLETAQVDAAHRVGRDVGAAVVPRPVALRVEGRLRVALQPWHGAVGLAQRLDGRDDGRALVVGEVGGGADQLEEVRLLAL